MEPKIFSEMKEQSDAHDWKGPRDYNLVHRMCPISAPEVSKELPSMESSGRTTPGILIQSLKKTRTQAPAEINHFTQGLRIGKTESQASKPVLSPSTAFQLNFLYCHYCNTISSLMNACVLRHQWGQKWCQACDKQDLPAGPVFPVSQTFTNGAMMEHFYMKARL